MLTGLVTEVVTEPTQTTAAAATSLVSDELVVESNAAFPESGGTINIVDFDELLADPSEETVPYVSTRQDDDGTNVLILADPLANEYPVGAVVSLVEPAQPTTTAMVATNDDQPDLAAFVPQQLKAVYAVSLGDGMREPGMGVPVTVTEVGGRWTVVNVLAPPEVASDTLVGLVPEDLLPDIPTATDGNPPTDAPVVTSKSIPGFVQLNWTPPANDDVIIGYRVYVGTDSSVAANAGTQQQLVGGTLALVRTLPDGTPMVPGTTYWFRVAAEDYDDVGPASAAIPATVGYQSTPDIATGSITASMLQAVLILASQFVGKRPPTLVVNKALTSNVATLTTEVAHQFAVGDKVSVTGVGAPFDGTYTVASVPTDTTFTYARTASNVGSTAVVGGLADPTQRWEADADGIRFYDKAGVIVIDLPTDSSPENPASFYGSMVAVGLIVLDNFSLTGQNNELGANAVLTMKSGVTKPSLAPTVAATYRDGPAFNIASLNGADDGCWDYDGGFWWLLWEEYQSSTWNKFHLTKFDPAGGDPISDVLLVQTFDEAPRDLVKIGDHVHANVEDDGGRLLYWNLTTPLVEGEEWGADETYLGHDYVDQRLITADTSAGVTTIRTRNPATRAVVDTHTLNAGVGGRVDKTAADFGSPRFVMFRYDTSNVTVYSTASVLVEQTDETFAGSTGSWSRATPAWNGTRFVSRQIVSTVTALRLREYSNVKWSGTAKWWVAATWRDSDANSPDFANVETDLGPKAWLWMKKRAFLSMSMSAMPASPVDAVTFYLGRANPGPPADTAMWRQPPPAVGEKSQVLDTAVLTGSSPTDNAPTVNGFPSGSPSRIESDTGGFEVDAEGHLSAPMKMQAGSQSITPSAIDTWTDGTPVVFDVPFDSVPIIVTGISSSATADMKSGHHSVSATGFTPRIRASNTTARTVTWHAMVP